MGIIKKGANIMRGLSIGTNEPPIQMGDWRNRQTVRRLPQSWKGSLRLI